MNGISRKNLVLGAGAVAGGWGGAVAMARLGTTYGLRLGPMGTVLGAAVGAAVGIGICKYLTRAYDNAADDDFEAAVEEPEKKAA